MTETLKHALKLQKEAASFHSGNGGNHLGYTKQLRSKQQLAFSGLFLF